MRAGLALALLIGTTLPALAGEGFDLVIPGRPGVPIIINGVDASYAVVEGDLGLGKGVHVQPTVYGGRYVDFEPQRRSLLSERRPHAGLRASRNRTAGQPQAAAAGGELSSIMVRAIGSATPAQPEVPFYPPPVIVAPQNGNMGMPREHMNEPHNPGQRSRGQRVP